jgi:hypothetical protein
VIENTGTFQSSPNPIPVCQKKTCHNNKKDNPEQDPQGPPGNLRFFGGSLCFTGGSPGIPGILDIFFSPRHRAIIRRKGLVRKLTVGMLETML